MSLNIMGFISGGLFGFFAGGVLMFVLYPTEWIQHPSQLGRYAIISTWAECEKKKAKGIENPTFTTEVDFPYEITPKNKSCNGDKNNLIIVSGLDDGTGNPGWLPTFIYNVKTGKKLFKEW